MNSKLELVFQNLTGPLADMGFTRDSDGVFRQWNVAGDICCAVAGKKFDDSKFFTIEIGFISPQILEWSCIAPTSSPLPYEGNGFGMFYRLNELASDDGFVFPPGGWSLSSNDDRVRFEMLLKIQFLPKLAVLLKDLLTWNGWIRHFQEQISTFPRGRGRAWALLGYAYLASPDRTAAEIEAVIEEHDRQDGSRKMGNRVESDIVRQRELLRNRTC